MSTPTRTPLDESVLRELVADETDFWHSIAVIEVTGSTNADLAAAARDGAQAGRVLAAERQRAGRGRLGREWTCPERAGLMFSMLLRPRAARETWGTLSLVAAVALEAVLREIAGVAAALKWPNDVLIGERKTCGILAAVEGDAVIVGLGLNVSLTEDELPTPDATSLALAGATTLDRNRLLAEFLRRFADHYRTWEDQGPTETIEHWRRASATLGRTVSVSFPNGDNLTGTAVGIGTDGRLRLRCHHGEGTEGETVAVAAGDIVHLRPGDGHWAPHAER